MDYRGYVEMIMYILVLYRDSGKEKWKLLLDGTGPLLQLLHLWGNSCLHKVQRRQTSNASWSEA